ncbi:hypothetical protein M9H77_06458 [Catharanthus roseus]|uniref:Uncharacterized protein n=1 Tax=Catharanthus roseus TaxID=4058 RepID=A0ACC0BSK7_CATRO|nr:hypothetical protein M9H77_06458 [Catharanthus roseus]
MQGNCWIVATCSNLSHPLRRCLPISSPSSLIETPELRVLKTCFLSICGSAKVARLLTRKRKCVTSGIRALVEVMTKTIKDQVAGSDTTIVESSEQGRGREEQRDPVIPKLRGKSKDLTTSFESRLTRVEEGIGAVDAHVENLDQRVEGLEADIAETHEEVREALTKLGDSNRVDLQALKDEFMAEVARLRDVHQREFNSLLAIG